MKTLLEQHPVVCVAMALALAALAATGYVLLSADELPTVPGFTGLPYSSLSPALAPLLGYLRACVGSLLGTSLA